MIGTKEVSKARAVVIGEVKAEIARKGLTVTDIGRITGRGQQYWSRRTTGETPFDVDDLGRLSTILQVPMSRFIPEVIMDEPENPMPDIPARGGGIEDSRRRYFMSPLSDSNRRPPLYIVDDSRQMAWPAEQPKKKHAA